MQKSRASFTVFFEDPFWVGVYEREEPGGLTACRVVFGAEPKDGEIYEWMLQNWAQLHFGPPLADARRPRAENPKRARRMADDALKCPAKRRQRPVTEPQRDGFNRLIFMANILYGQAHPQLSQVPGWRGARGRQKTFGEDGA